MLWVHEASAQQSWQLNTNQPWPIEERKLLVELPGDALLAIQAAVKAMDQVIRQGAIRPLASGVKLEENDILVSEESQKVYVTFAPKQVLLDQSRFVEDVVQPSPFEVVLTKGDLHVISAQYVHCARPFRDQYNFRC